MPPAIPPPLASYIQSSLSPSTLHSQTLITSVLSTPSPWLVLRIIYAALYGVEDDIGTREGRDVQGLEKTSATTALPVIFASFLRPLTLWVELGKKIGLDIQSLLRSRKIIYIDSLSYSQSPRPSVSGGGSSSAGDPSLSPTTRLKSLALGDVQDALSSGLKSLSTTTSPSPSVSSLSLSRTPAPRLPPTSTLPTQLPETTKPLIILDGIDYLAASQPFLPIISVQAFLSTLRTQSRALILTCSADAPLLRIAASTNEEGTPLERNHAHLVTAMAHQSRWVFQLRGLDTGSAKDVSGVVRASKGGGYEGNENDEHAPSTTQRRSGDGDDLDDAEWLYQLKGDGSVRVWGRGE
ncbi:hypothetical protein AYO21_11798 [Fonsecaea monophora]|uniref:Elongator complex protein 5 n=1 Tax=Fonsecaea monophora TaxID=254056 RepID=A0A177ESL5_9EURO|nr:hypothetical protein AYO21_11798 [Fonsecaea monophora]OAG34052.1 hypothetical protein AYO21_11798 [Fonsecaea monophora]